MEGLIRNDRIRAQDSSRTQLYNGAYQLQIRLKRVALSFKLEDTVEDDRGSSSSSEEQMLRGDRAW